MGDGDGGEDFQVFAGVSTQETHLPCLSVTGYCLIPLPFRTASALSHPLLLCAFGSEFPSHQLWRETD